MLEEDNPEVEQESDTDIRDFDEKFVPELESEQDPETEIEWYWWDSDSDEQSKAIFSLWLQMIGITN